MTQGIIYHGNLITLEKLHQIATEAAAQATDEYLREHGDGYPCGFAWVEVHGVRLSTKLGKALKTIGFKKAYGGGIQLWNPSKNFTQNVDAKYAGAAAYAKVFTEAGIKAYAVDRLD